MSDNQAVLNTDREIWRKAPGDFYAPRIFVNAAEGIGIDVGGRVFVLPVETWHKLGKEYFERRAGDSAAPGQPATNLSEREDAFQLALNYLDWMSIHSMDVSDGTLEEIQKLLKKLTEPSMLESQAEVEARTAEPANESAQDCAMEIITEVISTQFTSTHEAVVSRIAKILLEFAEAAPVVAPEPQKEKK